MLRLLCRGARRRRAAGLAALACVACHGAPAEPAGVAPVAGTWGYRASGDAGAPVTLEGTLSLASVSAVRYQGTLVLVQTGADGVATRVTGTVQGRLVDGALADFTVVLGAAARAHVGTLRGDTIAGRWMAVDEAGRIGGGGRFEAVRRRGGQ